MNPICHSTIIYTCNGNHCVYIHLCVVVMVLRVCWDRRCFFFLCSSMNCMLK